MKKEGEKMVVSHRQDGGMMHVISRPEARNDGETPKGSGESKTLGKSWQVRQIPLSEAVNSYHRRNAAFATC